MSAIITINDNHILVQQQASIASSQGYALLLDDKVTFDLTEVESAIMSCRLQPQQIQNRYWQQCAQTSIGVKHSLVSNSADLIWQHLTALRDKFGLDDVVFVVPSHYQQQNLQLLLGIADSSGLTTQGLINKAVMITQHHAHQDGDYLHIDLQLYQTVCSLVTVKQGVAKLSDIDILNGVSIQQVQDALLREMQLSFIQNNRFDPLHYAETEQQLFNQIADVAKNIALEGKANIVVKHGSHVHSIAMDSSQWNSVIEPFAKTSLSISKSAQPTKILMQLNKLFDGIVPSAFNQAKVSVVEDLFHIQSSVVDKDNFNEDGLAYRIELPLLETQVEQSWDSKIQETPDKADTSHIKKVESNTNKKPTQTKQQVTHLMQAGLAVPIDRAHISVGSGHIQLTHSADSNLMDMLGQQQLFVMNDEKRLSLKLNDRLGSNYADGVINAIQVLE